MKNLLIILAVIVIVILMGFSWSHYDSYIPEHTHPEHTPAEHTHVSDDIQLGIFNPVGGLTYRLQTSAGSADTSINLSSLKNRSEIALTMTLIDSDIGYGTLSPQTSRSEFISFSGITQNSNGTAQLTGVTRGLSDFAPFTASTTLRERHPGQSIFILSDSPQLFEEYAKRRNNETIIGRWLFSSTSIPELDAQTNATTSEQFVTFNQLNNVTSQGAATSSETIAGIIEQATQIEMASSTAFDANNPHTINSENATSTPSGTSQAGLFVPVSLNNGKLHQLWLDLTEAFSFSGIFTSTGTTTVATATEAGFSIFGVTFFKGVGTTTLDFSGTAANNSSSTVMSTDASGKVSHVPLSRLLFSKTTDVTVTAASETSVASFSVPANALGTDGILHGRVYFSVMDFNGALSNVIIRAKYGSTYIASTTAASAESSDHNGVFDFYMSAAGATNSQNSHTTFQHMNVDDWAITFNMGSTTSAEDSTGALTLDVTVTWNTTSRSITMDSAMFEIIR